MNILSLDMSSQKSGYSFFKDEKLVDYGVWQMTHEEESDWRERIKWMSTQLDTYCKEHKIDLIYVEDVPPTIDNSQTVKILSALQGCVLTICNLNSIDIKFISVTKWKNIIGIYLTHSKNFKEMIKDGKIKDLQLFKKYVKAYEKKLSVDNANELFHIKLEWRSMSSKFNQDDIADSINIGASQIFGEKAKYKQYTFEHILNEVLKLSIENIEVKKRGFKG